MFPVLAALMQTPAMATQAQARPTKKKRKKICSSAWMKLVIAFQFREGESDKLRSNHRGQVWFREFGMSEINTWEKILTRGQLTASMEER